ncbi:MAG: isoaspartyl peptidase/L-asparaginase [Flavobacteriaceae bacterium]|nr:isoaspartyl peptidase/L-asparaginase [Flavobacteriaceae bacterium]
MQYTLRQIGFLFLLFLLTTSCKKKAKEILKEQPYAIVIHGGAGTILPENMSATQKEQYHTILEKAIKKGFFILEKGGTSLTAVQKTIQLLEDSPLFNAGKGAVFDNQGKNKMDASIMDGKTLNSGAVAGVSNIKNPINAARLVMDSTKYVLLFGKGAEIFAQQQGVKFEPDAYFYTKGRHESLLRVQKKERNVRGYSIDSKQKKLKHYGTVGAVALDKNGNIAAATSTGGLTNKKYGRIGDSPIIGAGTYANNKTCGVSSTGTGEYFIRTLAAHEVSNLIYYKNFSAKEAVKEVIHNQITSLGGDGGMIVLDKNGNIAWSFNTKGMYRAYKKSNGDEKIKMFKMVKDTI